MVEIVQNALFVLLSEHVFPSDSPFSAFAEPHSVFAAAGNWSQRDSSPAQLVMLQAD